MDNPFKGNPLKNLHGTPLYITIAGTAAIGGLLVYRHHKSTGSWNPFNSSTTAGTSSAGEATQIDPVTGMAYSQDSVIDPITGLAYLAEAEQYGSVQTAEASVSAYGGTSNSGSGVPVNPASPAGTGTSTTVGSGYTSNAAWAEAATAGLASIGYSQAGVAAALGDYLTSTPVTPAQASLIRTALAEYGNPPQGSFSIIPQPASKPSSLMVKGLTVVKTVNATKGSNGTAQIRWDQTPGASGYKVFMDSKGTTDTDSTIADESGLSPGNHTIRVTPQPNGTAATLNFTIDKSKDWKD